MKSIVCMFSKTPGLSSVKTRISKDTGVDFAEDVFSRSIHTTLNEIQKWDMDYVVAVSDSLENGFWDRHNCILQTEGSLGDKLNHIYQKLKDDYDNIYFIGADSFHLDFVSIESNLKTFEENKDQFIIGKTLDGGFYLFGSKADISKDIWLGVEYSKESTSDELIKAINLPFEYLSTQFDLDHLEDLKQLKNIDLAPLSESQVENIKYILKNI